MRRTFRVYPTSNTKCLSIIKVEKRTSEKYKLNEKYGMAMVRIERAIGDKYELKENEIAYSVTELPFILGGMAFHINVYGRVVGHDYEIGDKEILKIETIDGNELRRRIETVLNKEYTEAYVNFLR